MDGPMVEGLIKCKDLFRILFFTFVIPSGITRKSKALLNLKKCPPTKMIFHFPNAPQTSKEKSHGIRYCLISLIKYEQVLTNVGHFRVFRRVWVWIWM